MHTVKEIFNDIVTLANILEENDIEIPDDLNTAPTEEEKRK